MPNSEVRGKIYFGLGTVELDIFVLFCLFRRLPSRGVSLHAGHGGDTQSARGGVIMGRPDPGMSQ